MSKKEPNNKYISRIFRGQKNQLYFLLSHYKYHDKARIGYMLLKDSVYGPMISSVLFRYDKENRVAQGFFIGETFGIPTDKTVVLTGTKEEIDHRFKSHLEYIALRLTNKI